jgi:phosphonate degradation associated HDIG domain protein
MRDRRRRQIGLLGEVVPLAQQHRVARSRLGQESGGRCRIEHALQTAYLAEQSEASDELVTACLLHDLGHLLNHQGETPTLRGIDDTHQYFALPFLRGLFPDAVLDAIKLHVDAKRYLCQVDSGYYDRLSADSKRSLALQGGVFDGAAAAAFIAQPGAHDAVRLRQWDDLAKQADLATPSLAHFLDRAAGCALGAGR